MTAVISVKMGVMPDSLDEVLKRTPVFRRLSPDDRRHLTAVASLRPFDKGDILFREGDASDLLFTVASGRVKVSKTTPRGTDVILEIFGPGDPVGAVARRIAPVSRDGRCAGAHRVLLIPRQAFFSLLEAHPTLVRGLLTGLTHRLVELTNRLAELSGGRVEARFARFFLKLAGDIGQPRPRRHVHPAGAVPSGNRGHDRHHD